MAKQTINIGSSANDISGDSLRAAFQKVNSNFTELYTALGLDSGGLNLGAFEFTGSTMSTTDSSAITIDQATTVTSDLTVGGDILPNTANGGNLGSAAKPWHSLYVSGSTIYIGGNSLSIDNQGELTFNNNRVAHETGEFMTLDNLRDVSANSPSVGDVLAWNGSSWVNAAQDTGDITFDGITIQGIGNPEGSGGIQLSPDPSMVEIGQYFRFRGGDDPTHLHLDTGDNIAYDQYFGDDGKYLKLAKEGPIIIGTGGHIWTFDDSGASLTLPGDIRSEGAINIDINLSDSTLRRWTFAENGDLVFPDNTTQTTAWAGTVTDQDSELSTLGSPTFATIIVDSAGTIQTYNPDPELDTYFTLQGANDRGIALQSTDSEGSTKSWLFNIDGGLTLPGDIRSENAINIDINLADSTLRRWQFGEDGELTLPEDAVVKTISGNLTIQGQSYVIIDSATNGQINIGTSSGVGAVVLGSKSRGTNVVVDDLVVANGVYEYFSSLADATGVVTHNCANGHLFYHTSPDANWTVNLTNLLDTWNRATSVTLIIAQGATGYYPSAVQIAGVAQTINWQGNVTPTPSINRTDVVTFSIINVSGTYIVLGQLTGF
jgi:hypothetical protein